MATTALVRMDPPVTEAETSFDIVRVHTRDDAQRQIIDLSTSLYLDGHETLAFMLLLVVDSSVRCRAHEMYSAMVVRKADGL